MMTGILMPGIVDWNIRPKKQREKTIEDIDNQLVTELSVKLFLLMNLTWGYVDTICNLCAQMKIVETKPLTRQIKELKRQYLQFRHSVIPDKEEANEAERGEWFEEIFSADFDNLFNNIEMEAKRISKDESQRLLTIATHQALTLIEAVKKYARYCDQKIKEQGVWVCDCCMVQTEFIKMIGIVRNFPTARDERFVPLRDISANILTNRLKSMEVWEEKDGRIRMKAQL